MSNRITTFTVEENSGYEREHNAIAIGLPLPVGQYYVQDNFCIQDDNGQEIPASIKPTAFWPDHSIKWLMVRASISVSAKSKNVFYLTKPEKVDPTLAETPKVVSVNTNDNLAIISVAGEPLSIAINLNDDLHIEIMKPAETAEQHNNIKIQSHLAARLNKENNALVFLEKSQPKLTHETHYWQGKPLFTDLNIDIDCITDAGNVVGKRSTTICYEHLHRYFTLKSTLHNVQAAMHPGGKWDLGDPNSINVENHGFNITTNEPYEWQIAIKPNETPISLGENNFSLHQESSAGERWSSPNHLNKQNQIPLRYSGYEFIHNGTSYKHAKRATPLLFSSQNDIPIGIYIDKFWQNFPICIQKEANTINLGLFSPLAAEPVELQPGEKKTHIIALNVGNAECHQMQFPLFVRLAPAWIEQCHVVSGFRTEQLQDPLQELIMGGLDDEKGFFAKREWVDEYGWRNFGEIYADHETAGYTGDDVFVSHYNNQYDPLYGFLKQWLLTGDSRWFELADDLALHITDIDIYDTDQDKPEYAGGLFWHTDHYVPACTATHRTYSKHQPSNVYDDHAGGGGPGGQHCYTSGLLLHYWLTGSTASKQAVLQLTDWITNVYEGDGTLFSLLLQVKNKNLVHVKNIVTDRYPLDRGTGNYIISLLDSYKLTLESSFLLKAEQVILKTINRTDDIERRNLSDVEANWFYTVLLQAVCRYLLEKEYALELDENYENAKEALIHYARWMAAHEYNYLQKPELLEFPNETWAAQDIRKCQILIFVSFYLAELESKDMRAKAKSLLRYSEAKLAKTDTVTYTRILALIMQNVDRLENPAQIGREGLVSQSKKNNVQKRTLFHIFGSALLNFSFQNEMQQAVKRFPNIFKQFKARK